MAKPDDGGPAFAHGGNELEAAQEGMSLRDYFAGQFLMGLAASGSVKLPYVEGYEDGPKEAAAKCYEFADAMIARRAQQ